ncbi:MAG: hypothetical protein M3342_22140, partial [Bacteroidota bacterium]|nr:hypothetical protein [Bacteroidota bacterium]
QTKIAAQESQNICLEAFVIKALKNLEAPLKFLSKELCQKNFKTPTFCPAAPKGCVQKVAYNVKGLYAGGGSL